MTNPLPEDIPTQFGTPLRDAATDPHPEDLRVMRPVEGVPGAFMQAHVDEPEFVAEVARRRAEGGE